MRQDKKYFFKSNTFLTNFLVRVSTGFILLNLFVVFVLGRFEYLFLKFKINPSDETIRERVITLSQGWDRISQPLELLYIALSCILLFLFIFWIYRATNNLLSFNRENIKYTPEFAASSSFIPIINLFYPYLVIRDIWKGSSAGVTSINWKLQPTPVLVLVWWLSLICASLILGILNIYVEPHLYNPSSLDAVIIAFAVTTIGQLLFCIPFILLCIVVIKINRKQELQGKLNTSVQKSE